jgi:hypothetical protein
VACLSLLAYSNVRREKRGNGEISIQRPGTYPQKLTGSAISDTGEGVRRIGLTHAKPPLMSDAPTWRYTDHAGAMVGTRPENIRGCA